MNKRQIQNINRLFGQLVDYAIKAEPIQLPQWRFDGEEIKTAEEAAVYARITVSEAKVLMEQKDVYAGVDSMASSHGVGTISSRMSVRERAHRLALKRRRKSKEKK